MMIQGLQRLSLLDYPGKVACTVFTAGCDFRCPFCHNASLVLPGEIGKPEMDESAFFAFLASRKGKIDGVCISGGEPLLQADIADFIRKVRGMGFSVKLDTNGSFPGKLRDLAGEGLLDYVAMDIKNSLARYGETVGIKGYGTKAVEESAEFLLSGTLAFEFRTTVVREFHDEDSFRAIGEWIRGNEHYYLQQFVDSGDLVGRGLHEADIPAMNRYKEVVSAYVPKVELRGMKV